METVAHHLQKEAINRRLNAEECDLFGRSAYNRYYYATFLKVREMFSQLDASWGALPHKAYPEILRGTIKKTIAGGRSKAIKLGDLKLISLCQQATAAASDLATLMTQGYAVRVIADYHPEIPVAFTDAERFELNSVKISTAHGWPSRAQTLTNTIEAAWKQINVT